MPKRKHFPRRDHYHAALCKVYSLYMMPEGYDIKHWDSFEILSKSTFDGIDEYHQTVVMKYSELLAKVCEESEVFRWVDAIILDIGRLLSIDENGKRTPRQLAVLVRSQFKKHLAIYEKNGVNLTENQLTIPL